MAPSIPNSNQNHHHHHHHQRRQTNHNHHNHNHNQYWSGQRRSSRRLQKIMNNNNRTTTTTVPLLNSPDLRLRFLNPDDLPEIKRLCREWFPVDYPDAWYDDITTNDKFYSVVAVYHSRIIGMVVAEIKNLSSLPKEDASILGCGGGVIGGFGGGGVNGGSKENGGDGTKVGYILSLGVVEDFRKNGVASFMLDNLIAHLTSTDNRYSVKAVYLHVLTTNFQAIHFYEHRGFQPHHFLPLYYVIKGKRKDGFTYVRYLNGGHPPWSVIDYAVHACSLLCYAVIYQPWKLIRKIDLAWLNLRPRLRQLVHSTTAVFT